MTRKVKMSDQDAADEIVRENAEYYNVVLHMAQQDSRVHYSSRHLEEAVSFAESVYNDENMGKVRAAMVYAVDEHRHFALVGTTNRFKSEFKPNVVKTY